MFGKSLVMNVHRSILVEAMVAEALSDEETSGWTWCSGDYSSHDFRHADGTRLEVKQTALRQSWKMAASPRPRWDISPRTGEWRDGTTWVPGVGRYADIYVFAWHPVVDLSADHRDPAQWRFFVLPTSALPEAKTLSLSRIKDMGVEHLPLEQLAPKVEAIRQQLR